MRLWDQAKYPNEPKPYVDIPHLEVSLVPNWINQFDAPKGVKTVS